MSSDWIAPHGMAQRGMTPDPGGYGPGVGDNLLADRYRLDEVLGYGGMATVYRGRDMRLNRPVAIKTIDRRELRDPRVADRFDREARTAARLAHPNIVAVYDSGTQDGTGYIVMELVDGVTVASMLTRGPLPVEQVLSIAAQTTDALGAAHARGIIHRDIKPANIMVTPTGTVKVCDFGIARQLHAAGQTLTAPEEAIGTAEYMAPEQAAGDPVDARTDLYALGCSLYAMLAGQPPFPGERPMELMFRHLYSAPVPLHMRRPDVPAGLDALVGRLLAKNPADRPADATEVRMALDEPDRLPPGGVVWPADVAVGAGAAAGAAGAGAALGGGAAGADVGPANSGPGGPPDGPLSAGTRLMARAPVPTGRHGADDEPIYYLPNQQPRAIISGAAAAAIVVVVIIAATLIVAAVLSRAPDGQQAGPPAGTSGAATGAPATTSSPSPTLIRPTANTVSGIRGLMQQLVDTDNLDGDAQRDISRDLSDVLRSANRGRTDDARKRIGDILDNLDNYRHDGKITEFGEASLSAALNAFADALPQDGDGHGGGGNQGNG